MLSIFLCGSVVACGLGTSGGFTHSGRLSGSLTGQSVKGARIAVGSKNFTEQIVLGKIAVILLRSAGAHVDDLTSIPGSNSARSAMMNGNIQLLWDYTGSGWISYLGHDNPIDDSYQQYVAVRDADKRNGLTWLPPAPMNNTYGLAIRDDKAQRLGITTISQLKNIPPSERTFCLESEFANRNDGFQPLLTKYGIPRVSESNLSLMDTGAIYSATAHGSCNFGEVFTTDGRITALRLRTLEDDQHFFPKYNVSPVFRTEVYKKYPQVKGIFGPVSQKLTNDVLRNLNGKVDVDGEDPSDVAWDWLRDQGFVR
ncbi:glycine betaine ABC transporter substrate-binding protein [Corynebacterium kroppenstedtii]|uniref:glycine betaine ABC transporter substrate-binding protein n=1 Tax=Corynebacterium sp. PCR 32 TaxID=3351342 RepID=UPI00309BC345